MAAPRILLVGARAEQLGPDLTQAGYDTGVVSGAALRAIAEQGFSPSAAAATSGARDAYVQVALVDLDAGDALDATLAWLTAPDHPPLIAMVTDDSLALSKTHKIIARAPAALVPVGESPARIVERVVMVFGAPEAPSSRRGAKSDGPPSRSTRPPISRDARPDIVSSIPPSAVGRRAPSAVPPPPIPREAAWPNESGTSAAPNHVYFAHDAAPPFSSATASASSSTHAAPIDPPHAAPEGSRERPWRNSDLPPPSVFVPRNLPASSKLPVSSLGSARLQSELSGDHDRAGLGAPGALTPELEQLLLDAEARVAGPRDAEPKTANDRNDPAGLIPADILAALEQPLDRDDDDDDDDDDDAGAGRSASGHPRDGTGTGTGTGTGDGTGAGTGPDHAQVPQRTRAGGTSTDQRSVDASTGEVGGPDLSTNAGLAGPDAGASEVPPSRNHRPGTPTAGVEALPRQASAQATTPERRPAAAAPAHDAQPEHQHTESGGRGAERAHTERLRTDQARPTDHPLGAEPVRAPVPALVLTREDDMARTLGGWIADRRGGVFELAAPEGRRQFVLASGDFVTCGSQVPGEDLVTFLTSRGDLSKREGERLRSRTPAFGRLAAAALIAGGVLRSDTMWEVLRSHAEYIVSILLRATEGTLAVASAVFPKLDSEPHVFGGATGASVFVEATRRTVDGQTALRRLGGTGARLLAPRETPLLAEAGLPEHERLLIERGLGLTLGELALREPTVDVAELVYPLVLLGASGIAAEPAPSIEAAARPWDPLDDEARRSRIRARAALVDEGDYFALLGVDRNATAYDIRRAYLDLRREFEPARMLSPQVADLRDDVTRILEVVSEAYEILRDPNRRERYRAAILAVPHS